MRTGHPPTDVDLHDLLRRTFDGVARAIDVPETAEFAEPAARRRRWLLPAAAAVLLVAGAGGVVLLGGGDREPTPLGGTGPTVDDYDLSAEERLRIDSAYNRMLRDCMATCGQPYTWDPLTQTEVDRQSLDVLWPWIGRTDPQRAATIGYQADANGYQPDPNEQMYEDPAWETAWEGGVWTEDDPGPHVDIVDPRTGESYGSQMAGGCFGQVWGYLYGDQARFTSLNTFVANGVHEKDWSEDPRLGDGLRAWRQCMDDKGYDIGDPFEPVREFSDRRAPGSENPGVVIPPPSQRELQTVTDDVACKESTGLIDLAHELRDAYLREAAASEPVLLAEYRQLLDDALARGAAFEAGDIRPPWRDEPTPEAPINTEQCTWLPDGTAFDLSAGEHRELRTYGEALVESAGFDADDDTSVAAPGVVPPPWILNGGSCVEDVNVGVVRTAIDR